MTHKSSSIYIVRREPDDETKFADLTFEPRVDLAIEDRQVVEAMFGAETVERVFKATAARDAARKASGQALKKDGSTRLGRVNLLYDGEFIHLGTANPGEPALFRVYCNPDHKHARQVGGDYHDQSKWGCIFHADNRALGTFMHALAGLKLGLWYRRPLVVVALGHMIIHPNTPLRVVGDPKAATRTGNGKAERAEPVRSAGDPLKQAMDRLRAEHAAVGGAEKQAVED